MIAPAPRPRRLAVVLSHPTQYYSPWFRWLQARCPDVQLRVFYLWEFGVVPTRDPQFGREVKTVRPRIPIVGMIDAISGARRVTLKVRIGPDGKVQTVHVFKSSGSNEIDQPCLIAMYDWWFEPLKDKRGVPVPDTILFTLNFR